MPRRNCNGLRDKGWKRCQLHGYTMSFDQPMKIERMKKGAHRNCGVKNKRKRKWNGKKTLAEKIWKRYCILNFIHKMHGRVVLTIFFLDIFRRHSWVTGLCWYRTTCCVYFGAGTLVLFIGFWIFTCSTMYFYDYCRFHMRMRTICMRNEDTKKKTRMGW